jgi:hypothetical protein
LQGLQGVQGASNLGFYIEEDTSLETKYVGFLSETVGTSRTVYVNSSDDNSFVFIPGNGRVGIGTTIPTEKLNVSGNIEVSNNVNALQYFGNGVNLTGIVTQIVSGIGININETEVPGKGVVTIDAYKPVGKTIYVSQNGDDNNTGFSENHAKRTIKSAASVAVYGDTVKVFPGVYVEENPIVLQKTVSVEGTELRNCVITPKYPNIDLFYVNNGCHITDISFIGPEMGNGASIISLQPLLGVNTDRYFDAARMIRYNLDYIAHEAVGFLTSGFSGFAGNHRHQDGAKLIDANLDFIAAEAVGFITSTDYQNPPFVIVNSSGIATDPSNCSDDIRDIFKAISYDLKANGNRKSVGAALSYFNDSGALVHITGAGVSEATIAALDYAAGITTYIINKQPIPSPSYQVGIAQSFGDPNTIIDPNGCIVVGNTMKSLAQIITDTIGAGNTSNLPNINYGVILEPDACVKDLKNIWKGICFDITRGGNSRSVKSGKAYYDENWTLIPEILKNPDEVNQTVSTIEYSFNIARSVVNNCTWGSYPIGLPINVSTADYNNAIGIVTITASNHGITNQDVLLEDAAIKIVGLEFTCPSGPGIVTYPSGKYGYIFPVKSVIDTDKIEVIVGQSTLPHTYYNGGTIQKYKNIQSNFSQLKDLSIQFDPETKFNDSIESCADVVSSIRNSVGIITTILLNGQNSGIITTYPGNSGIGFTNIVPIDNAIYDHITGDTIITASNFPVKLGDLIELYDLIFECSSGSTPSTQIFPSGKYGYEFYVNKIVDDQTFKINVGSSIFPHTYITGGYIVNRSVKVTSATYDNLSGIVTITAPGAYVKPGDDIELRDLEFSCLSGAATTTLYPTGNAGFIFKVENVISTGNTFTTNVGASTIPHDYVTGGLVFPSYSKGVGPITQGPYIRNCTNFIPKSIGMKVDGFDAEPGYEDDIGVTGTMSVDSYTQYNQGGIGVSITNGAYSQLVSIFTICDDIAIFTGSGGQCDLTNSNSSFGNIGLWSDGVGDETTKSIYRYTGKVLYDAELEQDTVVITGIGSYRPYDGQALYFDKLYYFVDRIEVINGGGGYTNVPDVIFSDPEGENGIRAEGSANIDQFGRVTSIDVINTGTQYLNPPSITISGGNGVGAAATSVMYPIFYSIESASLPSSGISTVTLLSNLNNNVSVGTTVYFTRVSLQITSSHSFEWVGAGVNINTAKPALGGVVIQENEVVRTNGGIVVYTSTDQGGNFKIGDDVTINQVTGTISGRAFSQSLLNTVTPLVIALGR